MNKSLREQDVHIGPDQVVVDNLHARRLAPVKLLDFTKRQAADVVGCRLFDRSFCESGWGNDDAAINPSALTLRMKLLYFGHSNFPASVATLDCKQKLMVLFAKR